MEYTYLDCLAEFGVGGAHPGGLQLTKKMLASEKIDKTMEILDAGSGTGQTSAYVATQFGCQVTALDFNKKMLEKAKKRFRATQLPIQVKHGSVEKLPFENESFDMIISESVTAFTDISLTVPELYRVLKPNSVLLAIEMILEQPLSEDEQQQICDFYGVTQLLSEGEWCSLFEKVGFQHIDLRNAAIQLDELNVHDAADFSPSEHIDEEYFDILGKHHFLTSIYQDVLGYRVFRCVK